MKIMRRLLCLLLVLSMLFTSGIAEILAAAHQIQETQSETYTTIPLTDLSDMFVTEETDPAETDPTETDPTETDPTETDPTETDPTETDPTETDPTETDPTETDPTETDPMETDSTEPDPAKKNLTETESHNFSYEILNNNTCRVTGYSGNSWETLEIPDTLDGYPVTAIGSKAFAKATALVSVTLPDSVTTIDAYAFQFCTALKSIELGAGLISLGASAFEGCTGLTAIVLPNTVETIGVSAFKDCSSLSSFTYPIALKKTSSSLVSSVFFGCSSLESVEIPEGVTVLPAEIFRYARALKSVTLPSTLTTIGSNAFEKSGIISLVLPDSVTSIGNYAFQNCAGLDTIAFGAGLTSIGTSAFAGCTSLTAADLPDTVGTIGSYAFQNCKNLAAFTYPAGLKSVGSGNISGLFTGCSALESIQVPEGVTVIPDYIFSYADALKSVTLPSTLTTIGAGAFKDSGILSPVLPDGVTSIGNFAFQNCAALESIELGAGLTSLGASVFEGCTGLSAIVLPDTLEAIGSAAFKNCANLASVAYPVGLKSVSGGVVSGVFSGCSSLESIQVPEGATVIPDHIFSYADALKSVTLPSTLTSIGSGAFQNSGVLSLVLPDGVTAIGNYAFQSCVALESIELGGSLTSLGASAFEGCTGLTALVLPDTLETIGSAAFKDCANLESVTYPVSLKSVSGGVVSGIFSGCSALESIQIPEGVTAIPSHMFSFAASLKTVTLPSTLTTIGSSAFKDSGILSLVLPDGVTTIGDFVFQNCTALRSIELGDSLTSIGGSAFLDCSGLMAIDLPNTVANIDSSAFAGCTGLKTMNLPAGLKTIRSSVFQNCTALESVIFCDGVTLLQNHLFSGCTSLKSVHLPRTVKTIQRCVFENCTALKEIYMPVSVTSIAENAFDGISGISFLCSLQSYATDFALDHQFPIVPTNVESQRNSTPLNTDNSYYIHNYDGLSAAGLMSMVVRYELRENAGVSPSAVTVNIYDYASLQENTLTLDGVLCTDYEYDLDTGRLTVPVTAASGTLRFCLKPLRYEALTSYARLVCTDSAGRSSVAVIGAVNSLMPALNITAQEETSASSVSVSGLAVPEAEVSLYVDGTFVKTVRANKAGDYCAEVPLNNPADGKEYIITAEAAGRTGAMAVAQTNVTYRYTAPELLDFTMIYGSRKLSLLELQGTRPVVTFTTGRFRFEVNFTNAEHLEAVYVVSTRSNVKKYLQAHWNEALGMFVAEGYFDPNDYFYIPGALSLEYVTEREKISFAQSVEFNPQEVYDTLPQVWQDAEVVLLEDSEDKTVLDMTVGEGDDQVSFALSVMTQPIPDDINEGNALEYGCTKATDDYGKTLYYAISIPEDAGVLEFRIFDFTASLVYSYEIDTLNGMAAGAFGLDPHFALLSIFGAIEDASETASDLAYLRNLCANNPNLTAAQKQEFNDLEADAEFLLAFGTTIKCAFAVAGVYLGIACPAAAPIMALAGFALGKVCDWSMEYMMCSLEAKAYGVPMQMKFVIDPSGYVYDSVTGKRLSDVTVHAYWVEYRDDDPDFWDNKPGEEEYGVLWASLEYSQMNPLITDDEGRYAWDVPEGWWRVSYEKEGYASTWSQWLPVPPPQTEVNIGMMPLEGGNPYRDLTGDSLITEEDAVYLLWHTLFPDIYKTTGDCDFNNDDLVNDEDALSLLWYALFSVKN